MSRWKAQHFSKNMDLKHPWLAPMRLSVRIHLAVWTTLDLSLSRLDRGLPDLRVNDMCRAILLIDALGFTNRTSLQD
jgi:hypothetical protein